MADTKVPGARRHKSSAALPHELRAGITGRPPSAPRPWVESGRTRFNIGRTILASSLSELQLGPSLNRNSGAAHAPWFVLADRYVLALALVATALAIRELVPTADSGPFLLFFFPVLLAAAFGGLGPGLLATATAGLAATIADGNHGPASFTSTDWWHLALFVVEGGLAALVTAGLRESLSALARRSDEQAEIATFTLDALDGTAGAEIAQAACQLLCAHLDAEGAAAWEEFDGGYRLTASEGFAENEQLRLTPPAVPGSERAAMDLSPRDVPAGPGVLAGIAVWMTPPGESPCALSVHRANGAPFEASERLFLSSVAAVVYAARMREASQQRFRQMSNAAPVLIWGAGVDGLCNYFNDRWLDFTGRKLEEVVGNGWADGVHPEDFQRVIATYVDSFKAHDSFEIEYRLRHHSREYRWVLDRGIPIYGAGGEFSGFLGSCIDISDRHRSEDSLALFAQVADELGGSLDYDEALLRLARISVSRFCDLCLIDLVEGDALHRVVAAHQDLSLGDLVRKLQSFAADTLASAETARVVASGEPSLLEPVPAGLIVGERASDEAQKLLAVLNPTSALAVPLVARGRTLGTLSFVATHNSRRYDSSDLDIAREIAHRAALSLDNARLFGEAQATAEDLRHANSSLQFIADSGAELASSLNFKETLHRLARLSVGEFADWCSINIVEGDIIRRADVIHRDPEKAHICEAIQALPPLLIDGPNMLAEIVRSGEPRLRTYSGIEEVEQRDRSPEHFSLIQQLGITSAILMPLCARGRTLGVLLFVRGEGRPEYSQADVAVAEELGRRAAIAMDNANLYSEAQLASADLRRANDNLTLLDAVGQALASSIGLEETLDRLGQILIEGFADSCLIDMLESAELQHVVVRHRNPEMVGVLRRAQEQLNWDARSQNPTTEALREGRAQLFPVIPAESVETAIRGNPALAPVRELGLHSMIMAPLVARGRTVGILTLLRGAGSEGFTPAELAAASQMGRRAGLFVDNARLFSLAQANAAALTRANDGLLLLADVGSSLGQSLDYEEVLACIPGLVVPRFADLAWLDVKEDLAIRRIAVTHRDPAPGELVARLQESAPQIDGRTDGVAGVIESGEPCFLPEVDESALEAFAGAGTQLDVLRELHPASLMAVPLRARGRVLGAMTFCLVEPLHHYNEGDLALALDLAGRAALFIDNARLYTEAQTIEADLRRANEAKDEFLGMMSHELRTPITVINGGARLLNSHVDELDDASRTTIFNDIEHESERLFRMVENLLLLSRVELNEEPNVEPLLLQRQLKRIVSAFAERRPDRPIDVQTEPELPPAWGEPAYLEHVLRNLLSNADKYSPVGEPITVTAAREDKAIAIRVLDRGVGITEEEAELIFQRFYRSERTARLVGGSGMGLAVCKRLVDTMSGTIWARRREGGGLEVGFALPLYEEAFE